MGVRTRTAATVAPMMILLLSACTTGSSDDVSPTTSPTSSGPSSSAPAASTSSYVALGDSFTAGPGIDPQRADAGLCQRSGNNWPSLVASTLDRDVSDVSCSGATTADLATTVASGAVPSDTGLVTVSAGGNDGGLFISLIRACTLGSDACTSFVDEQVPSILERTTSDLVALLGTVRDDAPDATVVLVGYPRIMPTSGTCDVVGITPADVVPVVRAEAELDAALATAADRAGVRHVSLRDASDGHDACAGAEAWTNGTSPAAGDGIVFHPNARGMAAVADVVATDVAGLP